MRFVFSVLVFGFFFQTPSGQSQVIHSWSQACDLVRQVVQEGDLIFLDMPEYLFRQVAKGTNSWTSHVGIAFYDQERGWIVAESTIPLSRETGLCDYLSRSTAYKFEVKRLNRPLTSVEKVALRSASVSMLNQLYHLGFNFDSPRLYCSKFVYLAYQSIGIEVGQIETFHNLIEANPSASLTFWKFWFFGAIPWQRRTVTPASQLNDPKFVTVLAFSE